MHIISLLLQNHSIYKQSDPSPFHCNLGFSFSGSSLFLFAFRGKEAKAFCKKPKGVIFLLRTGHPRMEQNETGCQAPQAPILCVNNCGFFGTAATMNMCSKCYKDLVLKQEQAKLAASSIENIVNGSSSSSTVESIDTVVVGVQAGSSESLVVPTQESSAPSVDEKLEKAKQGPNRCNTCRKRVGLTGFNCRCGNVFCAMHRYSDKHDCSFDYRSAGQDAIAKANPIVKAEKLDKI